MDIYENGIGTISIMNISSYNNIMGENKNLKEDEVIFLKSIDNISNIKKNINIFENKFLVIKEIDLREFNELMNIVPEDTVVVNDSIFKEFENKYLFTQLEDKSYLNEKGEKIADTPIYGKNKNLYIYLDGNKGKIRNFARGLYNSEISLKNMGNFKDDLYGIRINSNFTGENSSLSSFIIVGIYILAIFFINILLIIYYKQLMEGYEDSEQFKKFSRVGLSKEEINNIINKQITIFFFLPLVVALIHFFFARYMMENFILIMKLRNKSIVSTVELSVVIVYIIIYFIAYIITSKKYHNIVDKRIKIIN